MVQIFLEMSKKVGIFMIISQTLLHLGIAKTYEKYMRLVISFMVAAQIIFAFTAFLKVENYHFFEFGEEEFQKEWQKEIGEFEKELENIREEVEERIQKDSESLEKQKEESGGVLTIQIETIR